MSEMINKNLLEQILLLLKDKESWVRSSASCALVKIVEADPSLAIDALEQIKPLLKDNSSRVRYSASKALRAMIKVLLTKK